MGNYKCPHSKSSKAIGGFPVAMHAPYLVCSCCGGTQFYADSGSYSKAGYGGTTWQPKDLCAGCGGEYVTNFYEFE